MASVKPEVSLVPYYWGPALWRVLASFAAGLKDTLGEKQLPEEAVKLFSVLGGVLPCTYCRASYQEFTRQLLKSLDFSTLTCSDLPKFVFDLHNKVNDKLDNQLCVKKVPDLAKRLRVSEAELAAALKATRFCEGRRPSWDVVQTSHAIFSLKCGVSDLMSVLFMLAMSYPDHRTRRLEGEGADERDPAERRKDFDALLDVLPQVMRLSRCGDDRFADILQNTWERCTTGECKYDKEHMDPVISELVHKLHTKRAADELTREDMFLFIWVLRARYKEGMCSSSKQVASADIDAFIQRYSEAIAR
jgi:hypothetical protein